jgi:hypothetical protein
MSAVYPKFREQLLSWALNANPPAGLAFYVVGVDSTYVYDAAHNDLADVGSGPVTIAEQALTSVTITNGVVDAANVSVTGLDTADSLDALVVYLKDGAAASYLAAYIDESVDGSIPQGIDATQGVISWAVGGIFRA